MTKHNFSPLDIARLAPSGFASYASHGKWVRARHLAFLEKYLIASAAGTCPRLMISMPPRAGKSMFASTYFIAWFLGLNPDKQVMLGSYEATFAASWGRKVRDILNEHGEKVFGIKVRSDSKAADNWLIEGHDGGMVSMGAGGSFTGRGSDLTVLDDVVKNAEEASSKRMRDKIWEWWQSTIYTRLQPDGRIIIIMTRWNEDDIIGRILNEKKSGIGDNWTVVNIQAVAEELDPLGRKPGEALWPERYPLTVLDSIKQSVGDYYFSAMYQGKPTPAEGNVFKKTWLAERHSLAGDKHYQVAGSPPVHLDQLRRFAAVDLAMSTKTAADRTAIAICGTMPDGRTLLLDLIVGRFQGPDIVPKLRKVVDDWKLSAIGVEKNGLGIGVVQEAIRAGLPVKPIDADQDKIARAAYLATMLQNGRFIFPSTMSNMEEAVFELLSFPNGTHDDIPDALAHAARMSKGFTGGDPPIINWPHKPDTLDGLIPAKPWWD